MKILKVVVEKKTIKLNIIPPKRYNRPGDIII